MQDPRRWYTVAVSVLTLAMLLYGSWRVASGLVLLAFPPHPAPPPGYMAGAAPEVREHELAKWRQQRQWHVRMLRANIFRHVAGDLLAVVVVFWVYRNHRGTLVQN